MNGHLLNVVNLVNFGCWFLCFWWMHRISYRQNAVLEQLAQQTRRIEEISKEEHAILTDLHPNVEAIQHGVEEVSEKVRNGERSVEA